ncbi:MAG TPA: hypothetical protein VFX84_01945 [Candidatus Saccharimonadales bacterium]|nr:hypothetical protein [Candidatus Saccharimonadales bacterium]
MTAKKPDLKSLLATANRDVEKARRFSLVGFVVFVALLYGFVFMRISSLHDIQPSADSVTGQVKAAGVPHIDESVVRQLESLRDNSVNVQALFNEARSNPFSN